MDLADLSERAAAIKRLYSEQNKRDGHREWGVAEYAQGLVVDVGDLMKLIMARNEFRSVDDIESRIRHELADCLWSILVIARELDVELETAFMDVMRSLESRLTGEDSLVHQSS